MCGIAGAISFDEKDTISITRHMLEALQHRGQEGAGLAWTTGGKVIGFKSFGLVYDVFKKEEERYEKERLEFPKSPISISHNRYSTTGEALNVHNLQPIVAHHELSAIAHNGNLVNSRQLRKDLEERLRKELDDKNFTFKGTGDTEVFGALIHPLGENIIDRIKEAYEIVEGGYSAIIVTRTKLIAFRDSHGIRPLSIGKLGNTWLVASESCAFDNVGGEFVRDVKPGELITFSLRRKDKIESSVKQNDKCHLCIFEAIYFCRPDSYLEGYQVCELRQMMGRELAKEYKNSYNSQIFGGIPNSGIEASIGFAKELVIYRDDLFLADRYRAVNRTFIDPEQEIRVRSVSKKLNPYDSKINNRNVACLDDSIVRGNNTREINRMFWEAGASKIDDYVASPPIKYPCPYGIDTEKKQLIAVGRSNLEIAKSVLANSVNYLSIEGLRKAIPFSGGICDACFTGNYPTKVRKEDFAKEVLENPIEKLKL